MTTERLLEMLAGEDVRAECAPARLKSRVYSALVEHLADEGPLLGLPATKEAGGRLCIFEEAVRAMPVGEGLQAKNPCRVCHARVLGERLDWAPIFWPGCPYSEFHNG